ncbi:MAG: S1 RNA-binding domain-containing protein [Myxococcota bacterium]
MSGENTAANKTTTDKTSTSTGDAGSKSRKKRTRRPARGGARSSSGPKTGPRFEHGPPRFDVGELAVLSGPPLWQAVHPATVDAVTDVALFVQVQPVGHEPLRAAVPAAEMTGLTFSPGDSLEVRLLDPPAGRADEAPVPAASLVQARELRGLERVVTAVSEGAMLPGVVVHEVKGGYAVALGAEQEGELLSAGVLRAFLPRSQATHSRVAEQEVLGSADQFDVTELELERANIVVSRKARLAAQAKQRADEFWTTVQEGDVGRGRGRAVVPYGAFLDVGGVDGLLHMSDISWEHKVRLQDVVRQGQELDVKVIVLERDKKRMKLGLKQMTPDPWASARERVRPGADVEGDIVALAEFGAFVKLDEGVEGLVHLSEIGWDRVKHPSHRFKIGQRIKARVLDVDFDNRRISLSTKALEQNPWAAVAEKYPEGTRTKGTVRSLMDFGAFVELEEGVEGLVHIGELSWTDRVGHPSEVLTIGQEVDLLVLALDMGRQRLSCSIKRLTENPWEKAERQLQRGARLKAPISRVVDRGVYFKLEEGLEAFCPLRELTGEPAQRAQDVVKTGEEMEVEVKNFDRRTRKVTVSVRAVIEGETRRAYDEYKKKERSDGASDRLTLGDALGGALKNLKAQVGEKRGN